MELARQVRRNQNYRSWYCQNEPDGHILCPSSEENRRRDQVDRDVRYGDADRLNFVRKSQMTRRMDYGGVTSTDDCKNDFIIRGGSIISPIEIERALLSHPLVRDAAVFGAPDPVLGQRVAAVVQLKDDGDDATIDNILGATREQLADYKVPELLVAVDAVPRNPLGETDRQALEEVVLGVPAHRHLE
jgi:acyl-CoA synthetase (AMP-forming)/AMP-acid ligase II